MKNATLIFFILQAFLFKSQISTTVNEKLLIGNIESKSNCEGEDLTTTQLLEVSKRLNYSNYKYYFFDEKKKSENYVKLDEIFCDYYLVQNPYYLRISKKDNKREFIEFKNNPEKEIIDKDNVELKEREFVEKLYKEALQKSPNKLFSEEEKIVLPLKRKFTYEKNNGKTDDYEDFVYFIFPKNPLLLAYGNIKIFEDIYRNELDYKQILLKSFEDFVDKNYESYVLDEQVIAKYTNKFDKEKYYGINWKDKAKELFSVAFFKNPNNKIISSLEKKTELKKQLFDYYENNKEKLNLSNETISLLKKNSIIPYSNEEFLELLNKATTIDEIVEISAINKNMFNELKSKMDIGKFLEDDYLLKNDNAYTIIKNIIEKIYNKEEMALGGYQYTPKCKNSVGKLISQIDDLHYIIGDFQAPVCTGNGKIISINEKYFGEISMMQKNGKGVLYTKNKIEKGNWIDGIKNGLFEEINSQDKNAVPEMIFYENGIKKSPENTNNTSAKSNNASVVETEKKPIVSEDITYKVIDKKGIEELIVLLPSQSLKVKILDYLIAAEERDKYSYKLIISNDKVIKEINNPDEDNDLSFSEIKYPVKFKVSIIENEKNDIHKNFELMIYKEGNYQILLK